MIEKTHQDCSTCDWLAREAEGNANDFGVDSWLSKAVVDHETHIARYLAPRKDTP